MQNEHVKRSSLRGAALAALLAPLLIGSTALVGCSSDAKVEAHTTTVGQELLDLDEAYDKGLLTEDEYKKKRKQILDRR